MWSLRVGRIAAKGAAVSPPLPLPSRLVVEEVVDVDLVAFGLFALRDFCLDLFPILLDVEVEQSLPLLFVLRHDLPSLCNVGLEEPKSDGPDWISPTARCGGKQAFLHGLDAFFDAAVHDFEQLIVVCAVGLRLRPWTRIRVLKRLAPTVLEQIPDGLNVDVEGDRENINRGVEGLLLAILGEPISVGRCVDDIVESV